MKEQYPVIGDRPINQWKVTELKDELKSRGLSVKGLKNDLIKRLAVAIRDEGGDSEEESIDAAGVHADDNNSVPDNSERPAATSNGESSKPFDSGPNLTDEGKVQVEESTKNAVDIAQVQEEEAAGNVINNGDVPPSETSKELVEEENKAIGGRVDDGDCPGETNQGEVEKGSSGIDSLRSVVAEEQVMVTASGSRICVEETVNFQTSPIDGRSENIGEVPKQREVPSADAAVVAETAVIEVPGGTMDLVNGVEEIKAAGNEYSHPLQLNVVLNNLAPNNQVHVPAETDKGKAEEEISGTESFRLVTEESVLVTCIESNESVVIETSAVEEDSERNKIESTQEHSEVLLADDMVVAEKTEVEVSVEEVTAEGVTAVSKKGMENNGSEMVTEPSEPLENDVLPNKISPDNRLHEVSPNVGNQDKFGSDSTNSVSVFQNSELEDDSNVANVHLQIDAVKEEMNQLPSGGLPNDENIHATEDEKAYPNQDLGEKADVRMSTAVDFSDNITSGDVGSSRISKVEQHVVDDLISENFENKTVDLVHESTELTDLSGPYQKGRNYSAGFGSSSDKMETCDKGSVLFDEVKPQGEDPSERTHIEDEGTFEKINVDPSSTDDSMDEDTSEAKQLVSNPKSVEEANIVSTDLPCKKYETINAVVSDASSREKMEISSQKTDSSKFPAKRKFQDEVATSNKEPPKRQRNWTSNVLPTGDSGSSRHSPSAGNKNLSPSTVLKQNITKADSAPDVSKERIVPPSLKSPTNSLRINNFLRPFTLKAVQQLLSKTGEFSSFWMDQIKTHCYVTYSSVEEAVETRNSIYNLQWPPNGGRLLVAEFVDEEEVKLQIEAPPQSSTAPVGTSPAVESRPRMGPPGSARENVLNQSVLPEAPTRHTPPPPNLPRMRERLAVPPPPPAETEEEPPIATLDVLFRKTRETPRIYYLPLTDEEVALKLSRKRRG